MKSSLHGYDVTQDEVLTEVALYAEKFGPDAALYAEDEVIRLSRGGCYRDAIKMMAVRNKLEMGTLSECHRR